MEKKLLLKIPNVFYTEVDWARGDYASCYTYSEVVYSEDKVYEISVTLESDGYRYTGGRTLYFSKKPFSVRITTEPNRMDIEGEYTEIVDKQTTFILEGYMSDPKVQKIFESILRNIPREWIELTEDGKRFAKFLGIEL